MWKIGKGNEFGMVWEIVHSKSQKSQNWVESVNTEDHRKVTRGGVGSLGRGRGWAKIYALL